MSKIKYYYDTETCRYERVRTSLSDVIWNILGFFCVSLILSVGLYFLFTYFFKSPRVAHLEKENKELRMHYKMLSKDIKKTRKMLKNLEQRDNNIYRVIFEAQPIKENMRKGGTGGTQKYKKLLNKGLEEEQLIVNTYERINQLQRRMYIQTKSYDEIMEMARNKEEMLSSIPAIQPVSNEKLKRLASGFGKRIHPIYKVKKMHAGVDFSAPVGTPIYATGDGVVQMKRNRTTGYGRQLEIDHGYGFVTKYAHLHKFNVKEGEKVERGECIGYVGNSGMSVGPHLHYEVIRNGKKVNPVHYFFNDLNAEQYKEILKIASQENQSLS